MELAGGKAPPASRVCSGASEEPPAVAFSRCSGVFFSFGFPVDPAALDAFPFTELFRPFTETGGSPAPGETREPFEAERAGVPRAPSRGPVAGTSGLSSEMIPLGGFRILILDPPVLLAPVGVALPVGVPLPVEEVASLAPISAVAAKGAGGFDDAVSEREDEGPPLLSLLPSPPSGCSLLRFDFFSATTGTAGF